MKTLLFAALATLGACAAAAHTVSDASTSSETMQCDVRAVPTSHGLRFEAMALGWTEVAGEYEFVISKSDRSGASDIVQAGEFALGEGERQTLGSAELSLEPGGVYSAQLEVRDADGVLCSAEARP